MLKMNTIKYVLMFMLSSALVSAVASCGHDQLPAAVCHTLLGSCQLDTQQGNVAQTYCTRTCGLCNSTFDDEVQDSQTPHSGETLIYRLGFAAPCGPENNTVEFMGQEFLKSAFSNAFQVGDGFVHIDFIYLEGCLSSEAVDVCQIQYSNAEKLISTYQVHGVIHQAACPSREAELLALYDSHHILQLVTHPLTPTTSPSRYRWSLAPGYDWMHHVSTSSALFGQPCSKVGIAFTETERSVAETRKTLLLDVIYGGSCEELVYFDSFPEQEREDGATIAAVDDIDSKLLDMEAAGVKVAIFLASDQVSLIAERIQHFELDFHSVVFLRCQEEETPEPLDEKMNFFFFFQHWSAAHPFPSGYGSFWSSEDYELNRHFPVELIADRATLVLVLRYAMQTHGTFFVDKMVDALRSMDVHSPWGRLTFQENQNILFHDEIVSQVQVGEMKVLYPERLEESFPVYPNPSWACRKEFRDAEHTSRSCEQDYEVLDTCYEQYPNMSLFYHVHECESEKDGLFAFFANGWVVVALGSASVVLLLVLLFICLRNPRAVMDVIRNRSGMSELWLNVEQISPVIDTNDEVQVVGMGTFGKVHAAQFRGTKVAVKCVVPHNYKAMLAKLESEDPHLTRDFSHRISQSASFLGLQDIRKSTIQESATRISRAGRNIISKLWSNKSLESGGSPTGVTTPKSPSPLAKVCSADDILEDSLKVPGDAETSKDVLPKSFTTQEFRTELSPALKEEIQDLGGGFLDTSLDGNYSPRWLRSQNDQWKSMQKSNPVFTSRRASLPNIGIGEQKSKLSRVTSGGGQTSFDPTTFLGCVSEESMTLDGRRSRETSSKGLGSEDGCDVPERRRTRSLDEGSCSFNSCCEELAPHSDAKELSSAVSKDVSCETSDPQAFLDEVRIEIEDLGFQSSAGSVNSTSSVGEAISASRNNSAFWSTHSGSFSGLELSANSDLKSVHEDVSASPRVFTSELFDPDFPRLMHSRRESVPMTDSRQASLDNTLGNIGRDLPDATGMISKQRSMRDRVKSRAGSLTSVEEFSPAIFSEVPSYHSGYSSSYPSDVPSYPTNGSEASTEDYFRSLICRPPPVLVDDQSGSPPVNTRRKASVTWMFLRRGDTLTRDSPTYSQVPLSHVLNGQEDQNAEEENLGAEAEPHQQQRKGSANSIISVLPHTDSYCSSVEISSDFKKEIHHLMKLRHNNIVNVLGAFVDPQKGCCMVMEFMEYGSLYDVLHSQTAALDQVTSVRLMAQVAAGLQHLHEANPPIIHGDIKTVNILLGDNFVAKVADFGTSIKARFRGGIGSPFWMAPESMSFKTRVYDKSLLTTASDVYSFGVTMWEVFTREEPYADLLPLMTPMQIVTEVRDENLRPVLHDKIPLELRCLIEECWLPDPAQRPTIRQVKRQLETMLDLYEKSTTSSRFRKTSVISQEFSPLSRNSMINRSLTVRRSNMSKIYKNQNHMRLLHQMLPEHVAKALANGKKVEPESFDMVTIFFSDIVGYTDLSSQLPPCKVMHMLDRLYTKLDELCTNSVLFKVETIGDAYMCVGGMPYKQEDHTVRVAQFALGAVRSANDTLIDEEDESLGHINIRVGFHSGPVVASVVGELNPRYCLFGDTVNTASRMESNSEKNKINMSPQATKCLMEQAPGVETVSRGSLHIKGKGDMECSFLAQCEENYNLTIEVIRINSASKGSFDILRNKESIPMNNRSRKEV